MKKFPARELSGIFYSFSDWLAALPSEDLQNFDSIVNAESWRPPGLRENLNDTWKVGSLSEVVEYIHRSQRDVEIQHRRGPIRPNKNLSAELAETLAELAEQFPELVKFYGPPLTIDPADILPEGEKPGRVGLLAGFMFCGYFSVMADDTRERIRFRVWNYFTTVEALRNPGLQIHTITRAGRIMRNDWVHSVSGVHFIHRFLNPAQI